MAKTKREEMIDEIVGLRLKILLLDAIGSTSIEVEIRKLLRDGCPDLTKTPLKRLRVMRDNLLESMKAAS